MLCNTVLGPVHMTVGEPGKVRYHINVWIDWSNKFYITVPFYKGFSLFCEQWNTNAVKQGKQKTTVNTNSKQVQNTIPHKKKKGPSFPLSIDHDKFYRTLL